jgi:hypothetical protein
MSFINVFIIIVLCHLIPEKHYNEFVRTNQKLSKYKKTKSRMSSTVNIRNCLFKSIVIINVDLRIHPNGKGNSQNNRRLYIIIYKTKI